MGQILKSAPDGRIRVASFYTVGQIAVLMQVAHSTVLALVDQGKLQAFRMPTQRRDRRITHSAMIMFVRKNPEFRYMLDSLDGHDPGADFPISTEPPSSPLCPVRSAAPRRSPERPRSARYGKLPLASHYTLKEVAFLCGLSRRTIWAKVNGGSITAIKVPATKGPSAMRFLVPHPCLIAFIKRNPHLRYALDRLQGFDASSSFPQVGWDGRMRPSAAD
jgi:excisionase family DNA binding protein